MLWNQVFLWFDILQFHLTAVNLWQLNVAITEIAYPELVFVTRDSPEPIAERIQLGDQVLILFQNLLKAWTAQYRKGTTYLCTANLLFR